MKKLIIIFLLLILVGCSNKTTGQNLGKWIDTELKDVKTEETFKISDFNKPVLLESFAVWCPTCKKQQDEIKKLHEDVGKAVVSISLDTDPNENDETVLAHLNKNGYDWRYAIASTEMTQQLINDFGFSVTNAPGAPVILICNNEATFLKRGVKYADELKELVEGCE